MTHLIINPRFDDGAKVFIYSYGDVMMYFISIKRIFEIYSI